MSRSVGVHQFVLFSIWVDHVSVALKGWNEEMSYGITLLSFSDGTIYISVFRMKQAIHSRTSDNTA